MPDQLSSKCPAANTLAGPPASGPSVLCGILFREGEHQDGIVEGTGHALLTSQQDPSLVYGFCCGGAIPAATEVDAKREDPRGHYTFCSIWQQEKERIWAEAERAWVGKSKITAPPGDLLAALS